MKKVFFKENMHIHSKYSWDCKMELEEIVKILISNNIHYATITDHVEFGIQSPPTIINNFKVRNLEIDELNDKYKGKIVLLKGAEVGSPHRYKDEFKELECLDLDMIMGSIHKIPKAKNTLQERNYSYEYYNEILEMIKFGGIDVVGHIDYINRYYSSDYSDSNVLAQIFMLLKHSDMILEINTSASRRCSQLCFPDPEKLKLYRKFKDEIVIGSDAHEYSDIMNNLPKVEYMAKEMGFTPVYFEKRKKKVLNPSTYS